MNLVEAQKSRMEQQGDGRPAGPRALRGRMAGRRRGAWALGLALGVVWIGGGCSRPASVERPVASLPVVPVRVVPVQRENTPQLTEVNGTIRPVRRAVLASKVMGSISELTVILGQPVKSGDVLLKIFSADLAARLTQARTQLNVSRRDLERERSLLAKGASTAETVRNLQDAVISNEAAVKDAEVQLSYTEIRSPFTGVIARRMVNAGDFANPGQPLLEVEGFSEFEVETSIPESLASALKLGDALSCQVAGLRFTAALKEMSSTVDTATRAVGVKLAVPPEVGVRSGQFARISVPGVPVSTLSVPTTALSVSGQMERVFAVGEDNRASLRLVRLAMAKGDQVHVLSGLAEGERVVIAPPPGLRDGSPLEIRP